MFRGARRAVVLKCFPTFFQYASTNREAIRHSDLGFRITFRRTLGDQEEDVQFEAEGAKAGFRATDFFVI